MDWLVDHACRLEEENQVMKGELHALRQLVSSQAEELGQAWDSATNWRSKAIAPEPVLRGAKIAIIGPSFRRADYQSIVEYLGGRFYFAASNEKLSQIDRAVQRVDLVVFMTGYAGHDAGVRATMSAERHAIELVYLTSTGVSRLEAYLRDRFVANTYQSDGSVLSGRKGT